MKKRQNGCTKNVISLDQSKQRKTEKTLVSNDVQAAVDLILKVYKS